MEKEQRPRIHELGLPSEVVEAARSCDELSPEIQTTILDFMQGYEAQLSHIQSRMAGLQLPVQIHTWQDLRNEEEIAQDRLSSCRGLLSAMRRIPTEVMGEIFQFYLAPRRPMGKQTPAEPKPTLLCLVSRRWYAIAISTSRLWANVTAWIVGENSWNRPRVRPADLSYLLKGMDRFKAQPWSLTISPRANAFHYDPTRPLLGPSLHKHPACEHLQRLAIHAESFVLGFDDLTFPHVSSVTVSSLNNRSYARRFGLPSLPSLTQAVFANVIGIDHIPANIPWSHLTHLCLGGTISSSHWRDIFKLCTSLQRGVFSTSILGNPDATPPDWTPHLHLAQLDFVSSEPPSLHEDDVVGMSLPSLTKLRLFVNFMQTAWIFPPALFGNVTHLTIVPNTAGGEGARDDPVVGTLTGFPHLRELFVGLRDWEASAVLEFLAVGEDGTCNMPSLEALGVRIVWQHWSKSSSFPYQRLRGLVASRTRKIHRDGSGNIPTTLAVPLRHLVLQVERWFARDVVEDVVAKLGEAIREFAGYGLRISVIEVGGPSSRKWGYDWNNLVDTNKHWDEGLMDFLDDPTEFGLYPVVER